ncbi:uncharacterized protein MONBRDRAFT_10275 [Monosiga brevicollis MX1]|uniref:Uncharacterized protein n=1 Tax=Monosiga brevicollis TaxID=81824 RepID=A9V5R1_MONBE|nr:uncharacterized protein MONBRDRAFT_10275 [Monosiga brevicollis MX1]EDQ87162.1 predicted protein [Monosiga brevicollis MX1]|eukprot:XP_001748105.1 hypothetical protein [Monosiga brevicollis MX1]
METASLHDVSTQEQNALLTLALISIGYNPGTGAPRRLKLRTGPARSFIETIPSPSYSLFPTTFDAPRPASSTIYLKASNIEGRHDGRERVSRNLRREWRDFLTCLGRLASGAQPCPCQSAASNECECNTVALCQHLRSMFLSLPEWRTIAAYDNAKDIKLHLRGMLDISDRFTADPNDHTFDATLEVVSCQLNKHGLRLIRSGLRFTVERLDQGTGEWAPVPNPPRSEGVPNLPRSGGVSNPPRSEGVPHPPRSEGVPNLPRSEGVSNPPRSEGVPQPKRMKILAHVDQTGEQRAEASDQPVEFCAASPQEQEWADEELGVMFPPKSDDTIAYETMHLLDQSRGRRA